VAREPSEVFVVLREDFLAVIEAQLKLMRRVLGTTARKLVRLVHALLTKNEAFVARSTAIDTSEATDLSQAA